MSSTAGDAIANLTFAETSQRSTMDSTLDFDQLHDVFKKPNKQQRTCQSHVSVTGTKFSPNTQKINFTSGHILRDIYGAFQGSILMTTVADGVVSQENHEKALTSLQKLRTQVKALTESENFSEWNESQLKEVHGFVVLHLGNLNVSKNYQGRSLNLAIPLCHCLRQIYDKSIPKQIFTEEELQVAFEVLLRHAETMSDNLESAPQSSADTELTTLILSLLQRLLHHVHLNARVLEQLCIILVRILCDYEKYQMFSVFAQAQMLFEGVSNLGNPVFDPIVCATRAALNAIKQPTMIKNPNLMPSTTSTNDLFYWKCLAQSAVGASLMSASFDTLDQLMHLATSSSSRREGPAPNGAAATCLSLIAKNRQKPHTLKIATKNLGEAEPDCLMDALIRVLTGATEELVTKSTLCGLMHCEPQRIPWPDYKFLDLVLTKLLSFAISNEGHIKCKTRKDFQREAGTVLLKIVGKLLNATTDSRLQLMAIEVLEMETKRIDSPLLPECSFILNDLGLLCCSSLTLRHLKRKVLRIFEFASLTHENMSLLARQGKVLEALVMFASAPDNQNNTDNAQTKHLALQVLIRLAQDACNRRILVRQAGVLACMIRYARRLSDFGDSQLRSVPRTALTSAAAPQETTGQIAYLGDLKQTILDLANAL